MPSTSLNVRKFVTLKLKPDNYLLGNEQVLGLTESQDLVGYLTGEIASPTRFSPVAKDSLDDKQDETPEYSKWRKANRIIQGWIIETISEEVPDLVLGLETSVHVWNAIKEAYAQASHESEFHLTQ